MSRSVQDWEDFLNDEMFACYRKHAPHYGSLAGRWMNIPSPPEKRLGVLAGNVLHRILSGLGKGYGVHLEHDGSGALIALLVDTPAGSHVIGIRITDHRIIFSPPEGPPRDAFYMRDGADVVHALAEIVAGILVNEPPVTA